MNQRTRPSSTLATQIRGSQRQPRTMPVTSPDFAAIKAATMAGGMPNANFTLTSSASTSRRTQTSRPATIPTTSGPFSDGSSYYLPTTSAMSYASLGVSDSPFAAPFNMGEYDADPAYEDFLTDDAFSNDTNDLGLVTSSHCSTQGPSEDLLSATCASMDTTFYTLGMANPYAMSDAAWQRPLTPPPEEWCNDFLSAQNYQDEPCQFDQELFIHEPTPISKVSASRSEHDALYDHTKLTYLPSSIARRNTVQPRPIRSASERSDVVCVQNVSTSSPPGPRSPKDESSPDQGKARSDPMYNARPDANGDYHCPYLHEQRCNHPTTRQKCIYNKYVDSHLRPYRCKIADRPECEEVRFSSNACLFRHERETHGLHAHGLNPFSCLFPDCDRSREGNGFPRKWNQRDHMKRVHGYVEADPPKKGSNTQDPVKRRKISGVPTSSPMKRSGSSSRAKAHALAHASMQVKQYARNATQVDYAAPCAYPAQMHDCNVISRRQLSLDDVQFTTPAVTISRTSRETPQYSKVYST